MNKTTIQINNETLERLKNLKKYERQSYDDLLNSMLDEIHDESLSEDEIGEIKQGLEDIKKGNVHSIHDVAMELEIKLK